MYKVFIQNKPLFFIDVKKISQFDGVFIPQGIANSNREYVFNLLEQTSKNIPILVFSDSPEQGIADFFSEFNFIEAAGGIVKRKEKYLFIKRNGLWDLPKGKIDDGEDSETAAFREIEEECGIRCDELRGLITITYHVYQYKGVDTIKKTFWYDLSYSGAKKLKAQAEEGITKVKWFDLSKIEKLKAKTYPSIVDVIEQYFES